MDILKTDEPDVEKALHPEMFEALAAVPEADRGYRHQGRGHNGAFAGDHDDYVFPCTPGSAFISGCARCAGSSASLSPRTWRDIRLRLR